MRKVCREEETTTKRNEFYRIIFRKIDRKKKNKGGYPTTDTINNTWHFE